MYPSEYTYTSVATKPRIANSSALNSSARARKAPSGRKGSQFWNSTLADPPFTSAATATSSTTSGPGTLAYPAFLDFEFEFEFEFEKTPNAVSRSPGKVKTHAQARSGIIRATRQPRPR